MKAWGDPTIVKETLSLDKKSVSLLFVEKILHSFLHNLLKIVCNFSDFSFPEQSCERSTMGERKKINNLSNYFIRSTLEK